MTLTKNLQRLLGRLGLGLLVAGPAAFLLAPITAQATPADVQSAANALRAITTLRADFTQRAENGQQVSGTLSLKRGGKIRFAYQRGYPVEISSDGKALTIIDTAVNQIQRWPIGNSPLGALLDPTRDVTRYGTALPAFDANTLSIRVEDRAHPEYGSLILAFARKASAPGGLELLGWQALDAQNQRTTMRLANHQYGVAISDDLFRFTDPRARPHK
jgi:outer membrane lipoprotein-sorting protein